MHCIDDKANPPVNVMVVCKPDIYNAFPVSDSPLTSEEI